MNINRRKQSTSPLTFSFVLPLNVNLNLNCFFPVYPSIYYNSILIVVTNLTQLRVESERERMSNARCALYSTNSAILVSLLRSKFMFQFSWYFLWFLICFSPFFFTHFTQSHNLINGNQCLGVILITTSIMIRADPVFYQFTRHLELDHYYIACYLSISSGIILIFVSFIGCVGVSLQKHHFFLLVSIINGIILIIILSILFY